MQWAPQLVGEDAALPGFVDVQSDMQIASPQLMVDIDRDRALALGVTPQPVQNALFSGFSQREVSVIYAPANQYSVILELLPEYQRTPDALSKVYLRSSNGSLVPLDAVTRQKRQSGRCRSTTSASLPAVTLSFNLRPGFSLGESATAVRQRDPRDPHAAEHPAELPGDGEGVPAVVPEPDRAADRRDPGDLYRARDPVRELHPPDHDSFRTARRRSSARCSRW